jgi:hypothetical protein
MTNIYKTEDMILNEKLLELTDEQYTLYCDLQNLKAVLGEISVREVQKLMIENEEIMNDFQNMVEHYDREFADVPVDNQLRIEVDTFLRVYLGFGYDYPDESEESEEKYVDEESLSLSELHIE